MLSTIIHQQTSHSDLFENLYSKSDQVAERITTLPLLTPTIDSLFDLLKESGNKRMIILDQKVKDIENLGTRAPYGYDISRDGLNITVIDHHVSDPELSALSTGVLVLRYLHDHFTADKDTMVCITHKDCDSLLSSLMITGALPPLDIYGEAVMAADHTGQADAIADLLQAIEEGPKSGEILAKERLAFSIRELGALLSGNKLSEDSQRFYDDRVSAREVWKGRLKDFVQLENGTFYYIFNEKVLSDPCPEFVSVLLPEAKLILVFHNDTSNHDFLQLRVLRGIAGEDKFRVDDPNLIFPEVAGFGGRSDAGSNRRGGVSIVNPVQVAEKIDANLGSLI